MIFLTVGNWHKGFDRLVKAVDELKYRSIITEEVINQIGEGKYKPLNLKTLEYCSPDEFVKIIVRARIIISHAGMGTIFQATRLNKAVIVVPRKASLGEHYDDHQFATAKVLESENKVLVAYDISELPDKLKEAETFTPAQGKSDGRIVQAVDEFISKLAKRKVKG